MVQALTMAIGKKGIDFFANSLVSGVAVNQLKKLAPPNNAISVKNFSVFGFGYSSSYSNFKINLTNGRMNNFSPDYNGVTQTGGGNPAGSIFDLKLKASNFSTTFDWRETYDEYTCYSGGDFPVCNSSKGDSTYTYQPTFSSMDVTVPCKFEYLSSNNTYQIVVQASSGNSKVAAANIPSKSAINSQESDGCFSRKVSESTSNTISSIDFATPINSILNGVLRTIPASTDLGDKIKFDYALADAGLAFPNAKGVTIGATGVASFDGTKYQGPNPPTLPIPAVPTDEDEHYMNIYVSDWAINGLNWAYYSAGKLNLSLDPSDIPNPSALKAQTYASYEPAFKQYGNVALHANITPKQAPVTAFQNVYIFSTQAMELLQKQLPATVYQSLSGFSGDAYTSIATLEAALKATNIDQQYYGTIEKATQQKGMITSQKMTFELQVENGANPLPNVIFQVDREDVMVDLVLGTTASKAQSLQFSFINVSNTATFISTTIPGFNREAFGTFVWPVVGESNYAEAMIRMGKTGVAIPIAQGFSFLLTDSILSIQDGYVSISTQLEFKVENLQSEVRQKVFLLMQKANLLTGRLETHIKAA